MYLHTLFNTYGLFFTFNLKPYKLFDFFQNFYFYKEILFTFLKTYLMCIRNVSNLSQSIVPNKQAPTKSCAEQTFTSI